MSHRLNNAIGGHLHRLQALAQMAKGLVMVACHRRSAAQKAGQLSHGQGPVNQVAPRLLVARDSAWRSISSEKPLFSAAMVSSFLS